MYTNQKSIRYDRDFFNKINTESKAYWLGFLMADGCITDKEKRSKRLSIGLQQKDHLHLEKFVKDFNSNHKVNKYTIKSGKFIGKTVSKLTINCNVICNDLINLGCIPRKSLILEFPKLNKKFYNHFIRGYFDGDGSVFLSKEKHHRSKKFNDIIYVSFLGTKEFLTSILEIVKIGNSLCIKQMKDKTKNSYQYRVKRFTRCKSFYDYLYKDATIYLERKKQIFDDYFLQ